MMSNRKHCASWRLAASLALATLAAVGVETLPDLLHDQGLWPHIMPFQLNIWATAFIGLAVGLATILAHRCASLSIWARISSI